MRACLWKAAAAAAFIFAAAQISAAETTAGEPAVSALYKTISPKSIPDNVIKLVGDDWMLITAGTPEKFNSMTAAWGGLGVMWGKPVAFILVKNTRYTYEFLERERYFTLSFFDEKYRAALKYFGTKSGRDVDKVKETGLTPLKTEYGMAYSEARMIIVCKKIYSDPIKPDCAAEPETVKSLSATKDYHKLYFGEIVSVMVRK
jgi:flavin reductase (DIM6/NTAB) family NADH-FMN oxidoreductase RutF